MSRGRLSFRRVGAKTAVLWPKTWQGAPIVLNFKELIEHHRVQRLAAHAVGFSFFFTSAGITSHIALK